MTRLRSLALLALLSQTSSLSVEAADRQVPPTLEVAREVAIAPGTSEKIVVAEKAGPFRRSLRLHVPKGFDPSRTYPLVVALHGGVATARIFETQSALSEAADRHGFFVAYPNGMGIFSALRHWNGGYCCARARRIGLDDPGFLDRVRDWVSQAYPIDPDRHYVIGYSNGGMLAYWYAATRADELAGLGIWASSISLGGLEGRWTMPSPETAVPAVIAHGLEDPRLPFDSGYEAGGTKRENSPLLGAVGSARWWAEANGCQEEPTTPTATDDAYETTAWCAESTERRVTLLAYPEGTHDWPGPNRARKLDPGHPLKNADLAETMWRLLDGDRSP